MKNTVGSVQVAHAPEVLKYGRFTLNRVTYQVWISGYHAKLRPLEFRCLHYLIERAGTVVTSYELMDALYTDTEKRGTNIIKVTICTIRKKLRAQIGSQTVISTVGKRGYLVARNP